ncbi:MAG: TonB family protein [Gemmatimonadales bacterium]
MRRSAPLCAALTLSLGIACHRGAQPDVALIPAILVSGQTAIPYPPQLYLRRLEGEVTLYLVVDSTGTVVRDSTRIVKPSGQTAFDAAALEAAPMLHFTAARRGARPVTAPIQIPIRFTLPDSIKNARDHQ